MNIKTKKISSTEIKVEKKSVESASSNKAANINLEKKIDKNKPEAANEENIKFNKKEKSAVDSEVQNLKSKKVEEPDITEKIEFEKRKTFEAKQNYKTYDSYQNDRVVDEKKQSVKFDEKQPFPQFSLNVSNPISWKLMLLIMLMQLLTNMMLVVVLYLK